MPPGGMDVCLVSVLCCAARGFHEGADSSYRGVLTFVYVSMSAIGRSSHLLHLRWLSRSDRTNNSSTRDLMSRFFFKFCASVHHSISQMKHQLDATLCRFYFCRVTLHVSGLRPKHVEWPCRNKTCTMLHQVGVSFDLYYDARKHKIKIELQLCLFMLF